MMSMLARPEIIVPLGGMFVGVVAIVSAMLSKMHQQSINARLKEQMLSQGMSVEEMERVFALGEDGGAAKQSVPKPPRKSAV